MLEISLKFQGPRKITNVAAVEWKSHSQPALPISSAPPAELPAFNPLVQSDPMMYHSNYPEFSAPIEGK